MRVVALQNCGIGGAHVEPGAEFDWTEGEHGDTLEHFVDAGLVRRVNACDMIRAELDAVAKEHGIHTVGVSTDELRRVVADRLGQKLAERGASDEEPDVKAAAKKGKK